MINPAFILDIEKRLGILKTVKERLIAQPDEAVTRLSEVMDELYKMYNSLETALISYLGLYFEDTKTIIEGRKVLLQLEVGQEIIRINESRGHCHKIKHIYNKYLNKLFSNLLDSGESQEIGRLFDTLTTSDDAMITLMFDVNNWLKQKAEETLNFVDTGNLGSANIVIRNARLEVKADREILTRVMNDLRVLETDFIGITEVV